MHLIKQQKKDEGESRLQEASKYYEHSQEPAIGSLAERYSVPYSALWGRLKVRQCRLSEHLKQQVLSEYEAKSVAKWCKRLDEWGHPARWAVVKSMAESIVSHREKNQVLG